MLERRKFIKNYLNKFIPNVISNLISEYDYYFVGKCKLELKEHKNQINCCIALPDDPSDCSIERAERIITGSYDNTIKIWNIQTGKCEVSVVAHLSGGVTCCALLSDEPPGREGPDSELRLVTGSDDRTLKIWNLSPFYKNESIKCELVLEEHTSYINCCAVLPKGLPGRIISGSSDRTLKLWNANTGQRSNPEGKCELTFKGHTGWVKCCAVLSDDRIISGSDDHTIKVWNVKTGTCELTLEGHRNWVNCCAILSDKRIISGSDDFTIKIWDVMKEISQIERCDTTYGNEVSKAISHTYEMSIKGHSEIINCCTVLPDGPLGEPGGIISGSSDGTIKVWKVIMEYHDNGITETIKYVMSLKKYYCNVKCCAVLPDGRLISGYQDGTLIIWE
jgi:WD40 repeat protein